MVVKNLQDYMTDNLIDRLQTLQRALVQAETIVVALENENQRLKYALASLASDNEGYIIDDETLNESACSI